MSVRTYFVFSKTERTGILVVFILILIVVILPRMVFVSTEKLQIEQDTLLAHLKREEIQNSFEYVRVKDTVSKKISQLDINLATQQELENLPCIGAVMAKRILSYREKVKKFSNTEEIKKVYGLKDSCYQKILPYIFVDSEQKTEIKTEQKNVQKVNLNTCDSVQLVNLRGVGEKTVRRILAVRRKIKVFYDMKQLNCIGLNAEVIKNLQNQCYVETGVISQIQKVSLNTLEEKQVFKSPGFTYEIAKSFVQYRKKLKKQGKSISSWEELVNNIEGIDKQWLDCWQVYYAL